MFISIFAGSLLISWSLVLLNMNGFIILCSFFTIDILASWSVSYFVKLKLSVKLSFDLNKSGIKKLSKLHSSPMLFISGVPVSKNLEVEYNFRE